MPRRRSTGDANIPPERLAAFAVLARDHRGDLARIVEKPTPAQLEQAGPGRLVSMNCWRFAPSIFAACRAVTPSVRGELEIVDAVAALVAAGERMRVVGVAAGVLDLSARGDVRSTAAADPVDLSPGDDLALPPGHWGRYLTGFGAFARAWLERHRRAWPQQAAAASAHVTAPAGPAHPLPDSWQGN